MNHIQAENAVFKYAAGFLFKQTVDVVAQFADRKDIYAKVYAPITDTWVFSDGLILTTQEVIERERYHL